MNTIKRELAEKQVVKSDHLRKGDPLLIASRSSSGSSHGRGRSEAEDLRSKFESSLRAGEDERLANTALGAARSEAQRLLDETRKQARDILREAQQQAAAIMAKTEAEAGSLLARSEAELNTRLEREYKERYAEGLSALGSAADSLQQARTELLASLELPAFEMMQMIARQILMAEISHAPQFITKLISRGLGMLNEGSGISLRLHPEICQLITTDDNLALAIEAGTRRGQKLSIEADPLLPKAAFRLLTEGAEVAFDLDESLARMDKVLSAQLFPSGQVTIEEEPLLG
jgi:flagellar biosynthesis/type III secretory pathway protein FliH